MQHAQCFSSTADDSTQAAARSAALMPLKLGKRRREDGSWAQGAGVGGRTTPAVQVCVYM